MIVGAQKSGTSSLLRYLAQHPEIYTHDQPEMTYFLQDHEYVRGFDWAFGKYYAKCSAEEQVIAKNVMVMCSPEIMDRIYQHNPEIHLVVLLREPVARAYSAYWWARRRGWENIKSFEDALAVEEKRLGENWFKWRQCAYKFNSTYYQHVNSLIDMFGENQVHCVLTEELKSDSLTVCENLFKLMGVDEGFQTVVNKQYNKAGMPRSEWFGFLFTQFLASRNPLRRAIRRLIPDGSAYKLRKAVLDINNKPHNPPALDPKTRKQLINYFTPHNQQLSELLKRDLKEWHIHS